MRASTVEIADLQEIINLIDGKTRGVYSHKRCQIRRLVETTQLSFKVVEDDNKIVGFAAFDLEPDFESKNIKNDLFTAQSVLELMLFMAEEDHQNVDAIVSCVLTAVFKRCPYIHHVIVTKNDSRLASVSSKIPNTQFIVINREDFVPTTFIRPGKEEDNDDVAAVYNSNEQLKEIYGDFFFTEMVESVDDNHKILVADVNETAVGTIAISSKISLDQLQCTHHIGGFNGLTNYNAIAVQLFAIADQYEDRSIDLLKGAFEAFPRANWAILTVPRQVQHFRLLDYFQRVTPRSSFTTTEVYIVHRAVIHEIASVRLAAETDFEAIEALSPEFYKNMKMSLIEGRALNPTPSISSTTLLSSSYLMFAGEHAVGGVIMAAEDKIDSLRANFEIEDFVNLDLIERRENHKVLYYFVAPGFHSLGIFMLSEAMRLSGAMCLYQPVVGRDYPKCATTRQMRTIPKREKIHYDVELFAENSPNPDALADCDFGLLMLPKKLIQTEVRICSHSIVVVGASDTGIAAIEQLAMNRGLIFNNLTLVSAVFEDCTEVALGHKKVKVEERQINNFGRKKYGLNISLNRVRATLVGINSNDRKIILRDGSELPYDLLVLATGKQYSGLVDNPIRGVEGLAFSEIVNDISEGDGIFVRSNNINALGFIQQLLERKIKPSQITLAYESDLEEIFDLGDINKQRKLTNGPELDKVAARVRNEMQQLGVTLLENVEEYEIIKRDGKNISSVCVGDTEYECKHLVDMTAKSVSKTVFKALNDACLVYDGALVIDSTFSTSNENIMAAGPMTKYQRRLYADDWVHEKFNSADVGKAAAALILDRVLGRVLKPDASVPVFKAPVVTSCKLVGGRHYLSCKATYFDRLADGMKQGQARWLVTSNDECDSRIHLNPFGVVDGMIFVSREPLNVENIIRIFGLHEKYLKDLVSRFDEELIPCLYEHITGPFFAVISHDRFKDLVQQLEDLIPLDNDEIKPGTSKELTEKYSEDIDRTILNFIKDNQQLLPMYHLP